MTAADGGEVALRALKIHLPLISPPQSRGSGQQSYTMVDPAVEDMLGKAGFVATEARRMAQSSGSNLYEAEAQAAPCESLLISIRCVMSLCGLTEACAIA